MACDILQPYRLRQGKADENYIIILLRDEVFSHNASRTY